MSSAKIALTTPLLEARGPHEDWTGLRERKARRKLQNRLNVRAHRKRNANTKPREQHNTAPSTDPLSAKHQSFALGNNQAELVAPHFYQVDHNIPTTALRRYKPIDYAGFIGQDVFPLSLDHLIPLIQYNLVRACVTNATILSLLDHIPLNCHGMWGCLPLFPAPVTPPSPLAPTQLQEAIPHDAWIDLLPDATLRDNTLRALGYLDILELSRDLSGSMYRGDHSSRLRGILVWSDPWTPEGWEMSEGFVRKWGFLLKGCWRMLEATNNWRRKRNERPLVLNL